MQVEVIATTSCSDEPEQHSDSDKKPSTCTPDDIEGYHQILVEVERTFQVTYDSTADSHYWSYHPDATDDPAHPSGCRNNKLPIITVDF